MTFSRKRSEGLWTEDSTVTPEEFEAIDEDLSNAIDGEDGGAYAPANPIEIGGAGLIQTGYPSVTVHTSSSSGNAVPTWAKVAEIVCVGSGGGGGGGQNSIGGGGGGGGGSGFLSRALVPASLLGADYDIVIGSPGAGGAIDADGSTGGSVSFTAASDFVVRAVGGSPGLSDATGDPDGGDGYCGGGAGATASGGGDGGHRAGPGASTAAGAGGSGTSTSSVNNTGQGGDRGEGGNNAGGGGGGGGAVSGTGAPTATSGSDNGSNTGGTGGVGYGAGGGGGAGGSGGAAGGAGAAGVVIVVFY